MVTSLKFEQQNLQITALHKLLTDSGEQSTDTLLEIFDNLNQGIILTDQSGLIVVYNKLARQLLGKPETDVIGKLYLWDLWGESFPASFFQDNLFNHPDFPSGEIEIETEMGKRGLRITPLYGHSEDLHGTLTLVRDLEENQALEKKNLVRLASIGRIISAIAHEINNPLQSIRTTLELSQDPRKSFAQRQTYLETADTEISRIVHIIGQMRNFYRPTQETRTHTDVNSTVLDALVMLEKPLSEAGVQVITQLSAKLPTVSLVDYQLEQVVLNLVLNALDAMPKGGRLEINTFRAPSGVGISFQDDGQHQYLEEGRTVEHVFDPFENRRGSLGIGLSVSHEIIKEMGGRIEIEAGKSTRLIIYIPAQ